MEEGGRKEIIDEIKKLCREKQALIMAHYYTRPEIQEIADFIGDSLALARKAAETDARVIVMWCLTRRLAARWPTAVPLLNWKPL